MCYPQWVKASGRSGGTLPPAAKAAFGLAGIAAGTALRIARTFGLYVPAAYLAYGVTLHLAFGFGLFERSVDGALYIFGFALSFGCSAVIAVRRIAEKPLKVLLAGRNPRRRIKPGRKNAPEEPRIYPSRVNPGMIVCEYTDRYELCKRRGSRLYPVKTEWKKDKR